MLITLEHVLKPLLDDLRGKLPAPAVDLRYEIGADSTGDPAVFVWVILDDRAARRTPFERLEAISDLVRQVVRSAGGAQLQLVDVFPYVYFRTRSEQRDVESGRL